MKTKTAQHADCLLLTALLVSISFAFFLANESQGAENDVVDMIVELINGSDNDMRTLAFQQIRESVPGEDATRRFVKLLPTLTTDLQVRLIDALGERGDAVARPTILDMLNSKTEAIRDVAARALPGVANPADVPILAKMAATGTGPETEAARQSLRLLRGDAMNVAMIEAIKKANGKTKIELMGALVDRKVTQSIPAMLESLEDSDLGVRLAVLDALRAMASEEYTAVIVKHLKSAKDKSERRKAALTLVATCRRGRIKTADAVIAGFKGADAATRISLIRALPEAGGVKALSEVVTKLKDKDKGVSSEAVRVLAGWPDRAATPYLKTLAHDKKNLRNHILAIRGLARLASPGKDRTPDFATLSEAMKLATRKEEKVLVLGTLGKIPTLESLTLAASFMDQPTLAEDAGLAAVLIAEKIAKDKKTHVQTILQKVTETVQSKKTRDRANKVLEALQPQASTSIPPKS